MRVRFVESFRNCERTKWQTERVTVQKCFTTVNANIRRIALQPGVRGPVGTMRQQSGGNDDDRTVDAALLLATAGVGAAPATLSPNPKNFV